MVQLLHHVWLTPDRLTPTGAKVVLGLAVAVLGGVDPVRWTLDP